MSGPEEEQCGMHREEKAGGVVRKHCRKEGAREKSLGVANQEGGATGKPSGRWVKAVNWEASGKSCCWLGRNPPWKDEAGKSHVAHSGTGASCVP